MAPSDTTVPRLRFNILGPFEGLVDGRQLRLGGALRERTLVMLLLEAGSVLPVSRLVAAAWDEDPPNSAAHQIRKAVADLRQRIPGGSELIFQVHYTPIGTPQQDHSKLGLCFADPSTITHEVHTTSALQTQFAIPPGASDHVVHGQSPIIKTEGLLLAMSPHMHVRGKAFQGWHAANYLGRDLHHSRLGLVGFGVIGQAIARRLAPIEHRSATRACAATTPAAACTS
jgi:hypothetical protein